MTTVAAILVLTASETLTLRLRLLAEGEGITVRSAATAEQALAQPLGNVRLLVMDGRSPGGLPVDDFVSRFRAVAGEEVPILHIAGRGKAPPGMRFVAAGDWEAIRNAMREVASGDDIAAEDLDEDRVYAAALSGARILVVDDSVTYREYLRGELQREGAQVRATGDVSAVPALLELQRFDCVIVDLVMPGQDGASLCRRLARLRRRRGQSFFLLVMSSREAEDDLLRSLAAGADDFLGKSKSPPITLAKLRAILRRKHYTDSISG